jgi:hypothetical protein
VRVKGVEGGVLATGPRCVQQTVYLHRAPRRSLGAVERGTLRFSTVKSSTSTLTDRHANIHTHTHIHTNTHADTTPTNRFPVATMKSIIDFILSLVSPAKAAPKSATAALADALAKDVLAFESGNKDPALKKGIMQKAKRLAGEVGGTEMIVPAYAAAVR